MTDYQVKQLNFCYKGADQATLTDLSLQIPAEKITLLLGESGCGKSTFISILMNIIPEYQAGELSGAIVHGETSLLDVGLKKMASRVGMVFQNPETQFCTYTVLDELAFGLENLSLPREEIQKRIDEVLSLLKIEHLRDKRLHLLSGGEKQKVAIASVVVCEPAMLILDEPTSNLDPQATEEIFSLLSLLKQHYRQTILIVEHKLEQLTSQVDHLLVLGDMGKLLYTGDMESGYSYLTTHPEVGVHLPPALDFYRGLAKPPEQLLLDARAVAEFLKQASAKVNVSNQKKLFEHAKPALHCENLSLIRENEQVIKAVSFSIAAGDFVAIVGPNGAGKTTLLHSLLGVYRDSKGDVELFGKAIQAYRKAKWDTAGMVFQNPEWQFVAQTVEEEIAFGLKKQKKKKLTEEEQQKITQLLEKYRLEDKKESNPFMLSQGEKRRLSVASLLVGKQKLLLLDEPTFGQDKKNQAELMKRMQELNTAGMTLVLVTHDMDLVYEYCNKVLVMIAGECRYFGDTQSLFANTDLYKQANLQRPFWYRVAEEIGLSSAEANLLRSGSDAYAQFSL